MEEMAHIADDVPYRRRGRPSGKNRVPLSLDERRARNAEYERQRRHETSEAMSQLAEAAGCDPSLNNAEILATVISQLQRAAEQNPSDDIETLKEVNEKLMLQINILEQRGSNWEESHCDQENDNIVGNKIRRNSKKLNPSKRIKTESECSLDIAFATTSKNIYD